MNPIRVAHILPFSNVGGTEQATLRLAEAAAHCGFENLLYCPQGADDLRRLFHRNCFVTACYEQVEPSYHHPLPYLKAVRTLAHDLRRHGIRIVHCADILGAHYAAFAARLAGAYVISHVRCQHCSITRRDQSFLIPVQKFVFVSRDTWKVFGMDVPPAKGHVLYEGVPELQGSTWDRDEARRHYSLPIDAPVIGMASRVHPGKDFETLIQAVKLLSDLVPGCTVLIVGDIQQNPIHREYFSRLQALLSETGMTAQFIFAGFEADMSRFYAAIDGFVLSTHGEGFPLVILEAMAHERPVIATDTGGIPEIVVHEQTGLLVPPKSPEKMAGALMAVLSDPALRNRIARAGCLHVREHFSQQQFQRNVRDLYCGIAKQQGLVGECAPCIPT